MSECEKLATCPFYQGKLVVENDLAEVLLLTPIDISMAFSTAGTPSNNYEDSDVAQYLNNTWYQTLPDGVKAEIVDKEFYQDCWISSAPGEETYQGKHGTDNTEYQVSLINNQQGNPITCHVYALSV